MPKPGSKIDPAAKPRLRLRVIAAAESAVRAGHPWVFANSIKEQNRPGETGELAVIYDRRDRFLAAGLFDPNSPLRIRILQAGKPQPIDGAWWRARLEQALARRHRLFDDQTTGFRCVNGEGDGWPGLVLDHYADTLALKLYTAAWLPRLNELLPLISELLPESRRIVLRLSRNIQEIARAEYQRMDGEILRGPAIAGPIIFRETGLQFEADVLRGQKTGFFLDQRENRRMIETLSADRTVLNAFSFSGGFSLYAARGGARSVTDLDISPHALAAAKRNFVLNKAIHPVARCPHETAQADTFDWLANQNRKFGLIILDPPSLAKRESERGGAIRAYGRLTALGIERLDVNGILLAASCSAHVSAEEFFAAVRQTAAKSGRKFTELRTTGHAPDHPPGIVEMEYLKAIHLKIA